MKSMKIAKMKLSPFSKVECEIINVEKKCMYCKKKLNSQEEEKRSKLLFCGHHLCSTCHGKIDNMVKCEEECQFCQLPISTTSVCDNLYVAKLSFLRYTFRLFEAISDLRNIE